MKNFMINFIAIAILISGFLSLVSLMFSYYLFMWIFLAICGLFVFVVLTLTAINNSTEVIIKETKAGFDYCDNYPYNPQELFK